MSVALCFPGQGSQAGGMAAGLLELPVARELLDVAGAEGLDLRAALGRDDDALRPTEIAQPALLLTGVVLASLLAEQVEVGVAGVAGHSVGEYAALVAAGALDAAAAMTAVVARGRAMAAMREGTMAALLGATEEVAAEACAEAEAAGAGPVVVANFNAPGQVVLSGTVAGVEAAIAIARGRGVRKSMRLNVSGAFHSPLMRDAATSFDAMLERLPLRDARVPVVCNVDAAAVTGAEELRSRLRAQLVSPVRWTSCVGALIGLGVEALVELGPGGVLTGLARRIAPQTTALAAGTAEGVAQLRSRLMEAVGA